MYSTHDMQMVRAHESGVEEWSCPTCGRRILLRWPPAYEKRVLEPGDEKANHVGTAADLPTLDAATGAAAGNRRLSETGLRFPAPLAPP